MRSFILILAMVGVPLMTTPVSIDAAPVEGLSVVDNNGNNVGPVLDVYGLTVPRVAVQVNETIFVVSILEDRFASFNGPSFLYFNNPTCNSQTGQAAANILDAILPATIPQVLPWVFIGPDGGTVYAPSPSPNGTQISGFVAQSHFRTTGNPPNSGAQRS